MCHIQDFFERQRLMTTVKRLKTCSPSGSRSRGISQDILSIHTINRTYDAGKNTGILYRDIYAAQDTDLYSLQTNILMSYNLITQSLNKYVYIYIYILVNKRKNISKINLDEMPLPVARNKSLDLGPVHPVSSKIDIMEVADRLCIFELFWVLCIY